MLFDTLRPHLAAAFLLTCAPLAGHAEGLRYSIGLYAGGTTTPFDAEDEKFSAIPDFLIEGERFSLGTQGLTFDIQNGDIFGLSARLAPRFVVADPTKVTGLEQLKKDIAVEAGLAARLTYGAVDFSLEALKDVSDTHDGMAVSASVGTQIQLSDRLGIGAHLGATWMDRKLATYIYGVRPSEAGGGIAAYAVNEAVVPSFGIDAHYALTDTTKLVTGFSAEFLPSRVTNSPIVKRDNVASAMIGLRYAF